MNNIESKTATGKTPGSAFLEAARVSDKIENSGGLILAVVVAEEHDDHRDNEWWAVTIFYHPHEEN